jgi:hypothetical protein
MAVATRIDKPRLIEHLLKIDDKTGMVVPFHFNDVQAYFSSHKSSRNIVLKARQVGVSSSILADMFTDCITIPHTTCAVVSHETRSTQRLLDRVQFYYDTMGNPKPALGADSRSEKTFPELHSSIYVGTAGSRAFGRGDTIRKALLSELSFYEDAEKILSGVEDAVPMSGELTIECTPNGEDNIFFEKWTRAREGKSAYRPFFFPWWMDREYTIPRGSELVIPEDKNELTYTGEEIELVGRAHITEGQIRWRRWKLGEKGGLFYQEYPEDEVSCFLTIGDPVFDNMILTSLAQNCYEGQHHEGGWTYWLTPQPKVRYVIGADSSAGAPGGSYSAAVVLNDRWEVCATFQARLDPAVFAGILKEMGKWYNGAEIAVERNFTGYAVLGHMTGYGNLYHQRDFVTGKVTSQVGWWTNEQTKQYMMTAAKDHLAQIKMWDVNLVRQLRGYRYIKYKPTAQTFDDMAMALMVGVAVKKTSGVATGYRGNVPSFNW